MSELRIINRYPNRRLYDTETSCYITLEEVKNLVLKQIKFKIVDKSTNEDLTNYVLLQIISEQETGHVPIFTTNMLENIIRFYGNPLQNSMSQFLEKYFSLFMENNENREDDQKNPLEMITKLTKSNLDIWQASLSQYFNKNQNKNDNKKKKKN